MTRASLAPGQYGADELSVNDWIDCGSVIVTAEKILNFAELTGDRFEIHLSDEAARKHGFDAQVAHGLFILSLVDGLKNQAEAQFRNRASKEWQWKFLAPVLAGDTIHAMLTVMAIKPARAPDQSVLSLAFEVTNQHGKLVQKGANDLLVYR